MGIRNILPEYIVLTYLDLVYFVLAMTKWSWLVYPHSFVSRSVGVRHMSYPHLRYSALHSFITSVLYIILSHLCFTFFYHICALHSFITSHFSRQLRIQFSSHFAHNLMYIKTSYCENLIEWDIASWSSSVLWARWANKESPKEVGDQCARRVETEWSKNAVSRIVSQSNLNILSSKFDRMFLWCWRSSMQNVSRRQLKFSDI